MTTYTTLSNLRWNRREVDAVIRNLGLRNARVESDGQGYYVRECEADNDPFTVILDRAKDVFLRRLRSQRRPGKRAAREHARSPVTGVCAQVRAWAGEHPEATVQDALAAFPDANSTTVRIQFNKSHA